MPAIDWINELSPDTVILTANSRLVRYLQTEFDHAHQPESVWQTPSILPLTTWLQNQFFIHNKNGQILLKPFQELCIWEKIIVESKNKAALAALVKEAFERLTLWQVPLSELQIFEEQVETRCLIQWIQTFEKQCARKKWLTESKLSQHILTQIDKLICPPKIIFLGFDEFNPSQHDLMCALKNKTHVEIKNIEIKGIANQITLKDNETEIETAARWLFQLHTENPNAKLACVIPDLQNQRNKVESIFTAVCCPKKILPCNENIYTPFNISAGIAFSQHPIMKVALTLLRWCEHPLTQTEVTALLQSPYLCNNEKIACDGSLVDQQLREKNNIEIEIQSVCNIENKLLGYSRFHFLSTFSRENKHKKHIPSEWAKIIIDLLKKMSWPSQRTQTSDEFQALERFKKVMLEFLQLDEFFEKISYATALHLLNKIFSQTIFQPKSHEEPIQIIGTLEASSMVFDAMWVMGLHNNAWPSAAKPHPFIPYPIQQKYDMPHTPLREHRYCLEMTERLKNSAKTVIFSSPEKEKDKLLFPSRLLKDIPMISVETLSIHQIDSVVKKIYSQKKLESISEENTAIKDFSSIKGGSRILELQAECPFKSFADIRLKAKPLLEPKIGVSALKKGVLVHAVLHQVWAHLKDQQTLRSLSDAALSELISEKIESVFEKEEAHYFSHEQRYFLSIEKKRLAKLILSWLDFEKTRPPFRIKELESQREIHINALPLKTRSDRVDELEDGSFFLIDYKTGNVKYSELLEERLTKPQLPLYATYQSETPYAGVAFAEVRVQKIGMQGVARFNSTTKNITVKTISDWDSQLNQWRNQLAKLADDFCRGESKPDPVEKTICDRCDFQGLCRFEKITSDDDDESENE